MSTRVSLILQNAQIRQTPIRKMLLSILSRTKKPISVPELEANADVQKLGSDTVTIYRTLETFYQAGIVNRLEFQEGKFRYELSGRNHHHHVVCTTCGKVIDIKDCIDGEAEKQIAMETGFSIQSHSLEFFGLCPDCKTA
jgi:Fe2+ or Zn2+ uptake regulation protein